MYTSTQKITVRLPSSHAKKLASFLPDVFGRLLPFNGINSGNFSQYKLVL